MKQLKIKKQIEKSTSQRVIKQIQKNQQKSTLGDLDELSDLKDLEGKSK